MKIRCTIPLLLVVIFLVCALYASGMTPLTAMRAPVLHAQAHATPSPGDLSVVLATPRGETEGTGESQAIIATFNLPMVALSEVPQGESSGPLVIKPSVKGRFRWVGSRALAFLPESLPRATSFTATVPKGTKALSGAELTEDYTWEFNTPRPELEESSPRDEAGWVEPGAKIALRFNQPVSAERARGFLSLEGVREAERHAQSFTVRHLTPEEAKSDLEGWKPDRCLIIEPAEKLKTGTTYAFTVAEGLPGTEGNLGTLSPSKFSFSTYGTFSFIEVVTPEGHDPYDSVMFRFSNPVSARELSAHVRFSPDARIEDADYEYTDDSLYLGCGLRPDTRYEITISGGLKDIFGNSLGRDVKAHLTTSGYPPFVMMKSGMGVLESYLDPVFPVGFQNVDQARILMAPFTADDFIPSVQQALRGQRTGRSRFVGWPHARTLKTGATRNRMKFLPLETAPLLRGARTGLVLLEVRPLGLDRSEHIEAMQAFVQVTSLGITGKFSRENSSFLVTTLKDATPVAGVSVEIRSTENKVLWKGTTNERGLVDGPGWEKFKPVKDGSDYPDLWILARRGDDTAVSSTMYPFFVSPYRFSINADLYENSLQMKGTVFTERGIYRAGDEVNIKGILRQKRLGQWRVPGGAAVRVRITNGRGDEVMEKRMRLTGLGSFNQTLRLAPDAPTGTYVVGVYPAGSKESAVEGTFRVEAYRPVQFDVKLKTDKPRYSFGDRMEAEIQGWHLYGAPMKNDRVRWSLSCSPVDFVPPGWETFSFGPDRFLEEDPWRDHDEREEMGAGSGVLDDRGLFPVQAKLLPRESKGSAQVTLEGTVIATDERSVSRRVLFLLHPGEFFIGGRLSTFFAETGKPVQCKLIATDAQGEALEGKALTVTLVRRDWHSVRKVTAYGGTKWISESKDTAVQSLAITTKKEEAELVFTPEKPGFYYVKAEGKDSRGSTIVTTTSFYAWGGGYVSWARSDEDMVELVADKRSYVPGDTAKILVKSPWERARALVTVEREHIIERFVTELKGTSTSIAVPIKDSYAPNAYVSVALLKGRTGEGKFSETGEDLGKPAFRLGYVSLPVSASDRRLKVEIHTKASSFRPGDLVTVELEVKDQSGNSGEGEICFAAVDEGVLNLINYSLPDPFEFFYREAPLSVFTMETRNHVIGQRKFGEKGSPGGGGGMEPGDVMGSYRKDFRATACWKPSLLTDERGRASVSFRLPDSVTSFRLMAVGHTKGSHFGAGSKAITVNKPLMLTPSIPRFARPGDGFSGGVMVHNMTRSDQSVTVSAGARNMIIEGETRRTIALKAGASAPAWFSYRAEKSGQADLYFSAVMGKELDSVKLSIPVRLPVLTEAAAMYDSTTDRISEAVQFPSDILPDSGTLELTMASTALVGLRPGFEFLRRYPYECLEQRTSRILAYLLAKDLAVAFGSDTYDAREADLSIKSLLEDLEEYQFPSGGFGLWSSSPRESPFVSVYVLFMAARAKERGYAVDAAAVERGLGYLKTILATKKEDWYYPYSKRALASIRAYALYVLSLWDVRDPGHCSMLYEQLEDLPLFGRAMLLRAMQRHGGFEKQSANLRRALLNKLKLAASYAHFEEDSDGIWIYGSSVRTTALIMQTLLESKAEFTYAPHVVKWLVSRQRNGRWGSTQENLFALDAMASYYGIYEKEAPEFTALALLDGKKVMEETFKGYDAATRARIIPVETEMKGKTYPVAFSKEGKGRLYYGMRLRYAPMERVTPQDEGLGILKLVEPFEQSVKSDKARTGDVFKVTLLVATPQDRQFVVLDDPVPAGMEVVNTSLATESQALAARKESQDTDRRWWGSFDHEEIYDDKVLICADCLNAGHHTYTYLVRATNPGHFMAPVTKVHEMYSPEVFGTTALKWLDIMP
jgi:uncharacterized protein YfaS (alpha-2-macroglobulin family)